MFGLGPWELALVFVAILLLFGAKRLPEIASGLGKGIREFKKSVKETSDELKGAINDQSDEKRPPQADSRKNSEGDKKSE